ncbi:MAG: hypothetical protein A4E35_01846 [Methanoregula sp. PtaU1.Bin051]|nr:MAG: hypothetical protein A4E35_01846 [Methanoregula sp. PtaU1.Bin051]
MIMKKFVLLVIGLFILSGSASAYQINIDAPETLAVGKPLVVTGTTNFGIGTPIDVVLYHQLTTSTEIKRKIVYVQSDHTFRAVFDTTNLKKGKYKVEVPASGLGSSINMRLVELIDRTDEITVSSPLTQEFNGNLMIAGTMEDNHNSGVQIEVTGPDGERILGPLYIATDNQGRFSTEVAITKSGEYEVSFTDTKGYVGAKSITVTGAVGAAVSPTFSTMVTTNAAVISVRSQASRDAPAYFEVMAGSGRVDIFTSSRIDWVIEYIDRYGVLHTVNDHGEINPEEVEIQGWGEPIYLKVYPYKYSDSGEITLYAKNVRSVEVSTTVSEAFGASSGGAAMPGETEASLNPAIACCSALVAILFLKSRS